jgi:nitroreductase
MNTLDCIKFRKSIRAFSPAVPDRDVIEQCLEAAVWAPNPTSRQPWRFYVFTGRSLERLRTVVLENFESAAASMAELPAPEVSGDITTMLESRKKKNFNEMILYLKEKNVDVQTLGKGNLTFHGAPAAVIFGVYPSRDHNYFKSAVAAMENFILAATDLGLGTCWANAVSICSDAIKEIFGLHPDLRLVDGVALGYPAESPVNTVPRTRLPLDEVTDWFD